LLIELLDFPKGSGRLLDVGCGTGSHSIALANRGLDVVGIDAAPKMLDRAAEKLDGRPGNPRFQRADFNRPLAFPDDSFDYAICVSSLQCAGSPSALLRELARVLYADGRLVVLSSTGFSLSQTAPRSWHRRGLLAAKQRADRWGVVPTFSTDELKRLLAAAGFAVTATRKESGAIGFAAKLDATTEAKHD
jgi:ubiquinone/menaquinone biosynthesis C-methylase UbiE